MEIENPQIVPPEDFKGADERQEMLHKIERFQEAMAISSKDFKPRHEYPLDQIVSFVQFELTEEIQALKNIDQAYENELWTAFNNLLLHSDDLDAIIETVKNIPPVTKLAPKGFERRGRLQAMIDVAREE